MSPSGTFAKVTPIEGTIVCNSADFLEMWSGGRFKSTMHRVVVPDTHVKARQSIAYFIQPDNDVIVRCLDGSEKYPETNVLQYYREQVEKTYHAQ